MDLCNLFKPRHGFTSGKFWVYCVLGWQEIALNMTGRMPDMTESGEKENHIVIIVTVISR